VSKCVFAITIAACLIVAGSRAAAAAGDEVYQAIRSNDLAKLRVLVRGPGDANAKNETGDPLLLTAAAAGSIDAMRLLLDAGADVNGQNAFGATALIWSAADMAKVKLLVDRGANVNLAAKSGRTAVMVAAMSEESAPIVRLLASKGADLKAKDSFQTTLLIAAAAGNDLDTMRLALDAGVDASAATVTGVTALFMASYHANLAAVRLLLSKGARVDAVAEMPSLFPIDDPKSGPIALRKATPLMIAAAVGTPDLVKTLLDAGANVNAKDSRNMTALMFAVAKNHQDPAVIRLLIERGADLTVQSNVGETAADWARKVAAPAGVDALKVARTDAAGTAVPKPTIDARTGAERGIALLETSSRKFFETSGCVACHHQNITDLAVGEARAKGLKIDPAAIGERLKMLSAAPPPQILYERLDIGVPEILAQSLVALAALDIPANPATDALVADIAATQAADGSWKLTGGINERPPAEEGRITRTALCIRALKAYGSPGRGAELNARIAKARRWLLAAAPLTSEEHNMRLLGLHWAGEEAGALKKLAAPILAAQRPDGGWRQRETLASDAYATGQTLYVLAKTGALAPTDPAYGRGVAFLLGSQADNGSWRVASRAPKFQAYFNSGFPYGGDQWISAWATGWATMALAQAAAPATRTNSVP
jgi:ankyrin repeat protein